jgi:hypothetical protein
MHLAKHFSLTFLYNSFSMGKGSDRINIWCVNCRCGQKCFCRLKRKVAVVVCPIKKKIGKRRLSSVKFSSVKFRDKCCEMLRGERFGEGPGCSFATSLCEPPKNMNRIQKSCSSEPFRKVCWMATQWRFWVFLVVWIYCNGYRAFSLLV